jgi:hypothetical protein
MPLYLPTAVFDLFRPKNRFAAKFDSSAQSSKELTNHTISGITSNGTYFLCTILYKTNPNLHGDGYSENMNKRRLPDIGTLIDQYANTQDKSLRLALQQEIHTKCGADADIALILNPNETASGFLIGSRLYIVSFAAKRPIQFDEAGVFAETEPNSCFIFILAKGYTSTSAEVHNYIQQAQYYHLDDLLPNYNVINAIKHKIDSDRCRDMKCYLKSACDALALNPIIQHSITSLYAALNKCPSSQSEQICKIISLTLELLEVQDDIIRVRLLNEYHRFAMKLYLTNISWDRVLYTTMILLGLGILISNLIFTVPHTLIMLSASNLIMAICLFAISSLLPEETRRLENQQQMRTLAGTLFSLKKVIAETAIPNQILAPKTYTAPYY